MLWDADKVKQWVEASLRMERNVEFSADVILSKDRLARVSSGSLEITPMSPAGSCDPILDEDAQSRNDRKRSEVLLMSDKDIKADISRDRPLLEFLTHVATEYPPLHPFQIPATRSPDKLVRLGLKAYNCEHSGWTGRWDEVVCYSICQKLSEYPGGKSAAAMTVKVVRQVCYESVKWFKEKPIGKEWLFVTQDQSLGGGESGCHRSGGGRTGLETVVSKSGCIFKEGSMVGIARRVSFASS